MSTRHPRHALWAKALDAKCPPDVADALADAHGIARAEGLVAEFGGSAPAEAMARAYWERVAKQARETTRAN